MQVLAKVEVQGIEIKKKERAKKRPIITDPCSIQILPYLKSNISLPSPSPTADIIELLTPTLSSMSVSTAESTISQHKRTTSTTSTASYGNSSKSNESPPQITDKPELHVQEPQNLFVTLIMDTIWKSGAPIPWAQGRKMWVYYPLYGSNDYRDTN